MKAIHFWKMALLGFALGVFPACKSSSNAQNKSSTTSSNSQTMNKTHFIAPEFEKSIAILPKADLEKAVAKAKDDGSVWKIPVWVTRGDLGGVKTAFIGVAADLSEAEQVKVQLNDSRLGISLSDRIAERCGDEKACVLWLIGAWTSGDLGISASDLPYFAIMSVTDAPSSAPATNDIASVYLTK